MQRFGVRPLGSFASVTFTLALLASGCEEEEPGKLFNEAGSWSLIEYDLSGVQVKAVNNLRENAYLLKFRPDLGVVQTAACLSEGQGADDEDPGDGECRLQASTSRWSCRCFAYAYEESSMAWKAFDAGSTPPPVGLLPPGTPLGTSVEGDPATIPQAGAYEITLLSDQERRSTYTFSPLPFPVFGSNGSSSLFVFQARNPSLFDAVFNDPEGRPGCAPCVENF